MPPATKVKMLCLDEKCAPAHVEVPYGDFLKHVLSHHEPAEDSGKKAKKATKTKADGKKAKEEKSAKTLIFQVVCLERCGGVAPPFCMFVAAHEDATFEELDNILRQRVSCCGHLSCFEGPTLKEGPTDDLGRLQFNGYGPDIEGMQLGGDVPEEPNPTLGSRFDLKTRVMWEYDFGTTTTLGIECAAIVENPGRSMDDSAIAMVGISRLDVPVCPGCGAQSTKYCVAHRKNPFHCEKASCKATASCKQHSDSYWFSISNSPRIGMCGFDRDPDETVFFAKPKGSASATKRVVADRKRVRD